MLSSISRNLSLLLWLTDLYALLCIQVPLDGSIVYGESLVSMQHITGENLPVRHAYGAQVPAGSENHDGVLVLRVTQSASDSTPARITRLARQAQVCWPRSGNSFVSELYQCRL